MRVRTCVMPVATLAILLVLWKSATVWYEISAALLPTPEAVLARLWVSIANWELQPQLWATLEATLTGYALGSVAAISLAVLLVEIQVLERLFYPVLVTFQSMPKVAIAPFVLIWLGYGTASEIVLVALICFFPPFINTFNALRETNQNLVDLYRVLSASRLRIVFAVKIPNAALPIFTGLQVGLIFALIGCVVMEFVIGLEGIGFVIINSANSLDTALSLAATIGLSLMGVALTESLKLVQRRVVFWSS